MLSDEDIAKLCQGRIIHAKDLLNSARTNAAGPHYAVMLDPDEKIKNSDSFRCAIISSNDEIDSTFIVPAPAETGLTGNVICSWIEIIHLAGIDRKPGPKVLPYSLKKINDQIRAWQESLKKRG